MVSPLYQFQCIIFFTHDVLLVLNRLVFIRDVLSRAQRDMEPDIPTHRPRVLDEVRPGASAHPVAVVSAATVHQRLTLGERLRQD